MVVEFIPGGEISGMRAFFATMSLGVAALFFLGLVPWYLWIPFFLCYLMIVEGESRGYW